MGQTSPPPPQASFRPVQEDKGRAASILWSSSWTRVRDDLLQITVFPSVVTESAERLPPFLGQPHTQVSNISFFFLLESSPIRAHPGTVFFPRWSDTGERVCRLLFFSLTSGAGRRRKWELDPLGRQPKEQVVVISF